MRRRASIATTMHCAPNSSAPAGDDLGSLDRGGVERHLVGAGAQHAAHVLDAAHAAADGERDEHLVGDPLDDVHHRVAVVGRRGDVEEHELVGAFGVVARRELDRIAGVAELGEPHAFHDAARVDVEARDHTDGEHAAIPSSIGEPAFVDRRAGDRAGEPPAVDLERGERAQVVERRDAAARDHRHGHRAAAPPRAARGRGRCSMPSREISVTTSAPTPGRSKRRASSTRSSPVAAVQPCVDDVAATRVEADRDASREASRELVDELGPFDRGGPDDDALDAGVEQRARPRRRRARRRRSAPCTSRAAQIAVDRRRDSSRHPSARRRGRRRGSSARPPLRSAARPRPDRRRRASRARSRPVAVARRGRRAGRSPDTDPCSWGSGRGLDEVREQPQPRVAALLGVELRRPHGPGSIAAAKRRPYVAPRGDDRVVRRVGRVRVHEVQPRLGAEPGREPAPGPRSRACSSRSAAAAPCREAGSTRPGDDAETRRRRATRRCPRTASASRRRRRGTAGRRLRLPSPPVRARSRAAPACTRRSADAGQHDRVGAARSRRRRR